MNQIGSIRNNVGINIPAAQAKVNADKKDDMPLFSTVEWNNKNDGNTYVAKKIKLTQNGKELTGIYVYRKDAEPDKNGQIKGEFMSYETFLKKMADEVPSVNVNTAKGYFPNIHETKSEKKLPPQVELSLDETINEGTKLPDGSTILRHCICGSMNKIEVNENGKYTLTTQGVYMGSKPSTRPISVKEIVTNKWLCGGTAKKVGEDKYEVRYFAGGDPKNGVEKATMTGAELEEFMQKENLLTY